MYEYGTHGHRDPNVRASDADREEFGDLLRRHHTDGRIDADEFQERIDSCYQAKTTGELRQLVNDLPNDYHERSESQFRLRRLWPVPLVPLLIAIWVISIATGGHHRHFGLLWLIPLLFAIRFVMSPYRRWGMRRRYRFPRGL